MLGQGRELWVPTQDRHVGGSWPGLCSINAHLPCGFAQLPSHSEPCCSSKNWQWSFLPSLLHSGIKGRVPLSCAACWGGSRVRWDRCGFEPGKSLGLNLGSISVSCVSLGKLLSHSEPVSSVIKMVLIIIPTS